MSSVRSRTSEPTLPPCSVKGEIRSRKPARSDSSEPGFTVGPEPWCARRSASSLSFTSTSSRFNDRKGGGAPFVAAHTTLTDGGSKAAFRSSSQRFKVKRFVGESSEDIAEMSEHRSRTQSPGAHSRGTTRSASTSVLTTNSAFSRSSSGFGRSSTPRFHETRETSKVDRPGPGAYDALSVDANGRPTIDGIVKTGTRPASTSFASLSSRFNGAAATGQEAPPPGAYEPKVVDRPPPSAGAGFGRYKAGRFRTLKPASTKANATAYNVKRFGDDPAEQMTCPRGAIAFGATSARFS